MTEGELKKKLWYWLTETACSKEEPDFLDLARFQAEEDLQKIVEEAKQEFPLREWIPPRKITGYVQFTLEDYTLFVTDLLDWFKKWFGDKEK